MSMQARTVTMRGKPLKLMGGELKAGDQAPDFEAIGNDLSAVRLASFRGKVRVLLTVPSLDTRVCDMEIRKFNEEIAKLGADVIGLTVSMDLPFAQKRWCGAAGVQRVITVSDHRDASFGKTYGVLLEGLRLLARAVFVVDRDDVIRYVEVVRELGDPPDYQAALEAVKKLL
jgi:thiol peroxidase